MNDSGSRKKAGKKAKGKGSSSPKSAKSGKSAKSRSSSGRISPKEDPRPAEIPGLACMRHHKELKYFCDYHEELLCEDCLSSPPFTTSQTKILKIEEAYRLRFSAAYQLLNSQIYSKRKQITNQLAQIQQRLDQIRSVKSSIEKDMKGEFSAMSERLSSSYGSKAALLEYDITELQADIDRIDSIVESIQRANSDIHGFLSKFTHIRDTVDMILAKPFRTEIDVDPNSLPKELIEIRDNVMQYPALKNLLVTKDEILWKLTHEGSGAGKVDDATQQELAEWAKLTERFSVELAKYRMVCEYCGTQLDNISVNSNCARNSGSRHYFIKL